jgi:hypothetical protein
MSHDLKVLVRILCLDLGVVFGTLSTAPGGPSAFMYGSVSGIFLTVYVIMGEPS